MNNTAGFTIATAVGLPKTLGVYFVCELAKNSLRYRVARRFVLPGEEFSGISAGLDKTSVRTAQAAAVVRGNGHSPEGPGLRNAKGSGPANRATHRPRSQGEPLTAERRNAYTFNALTPEY